MLMRGFRLLVLVASLGPGALLPAAADTTSAPGPDAGALVGYVSAVRLHLARDPVLAATYISFWSDLARSGDPATLSADRLEQITLRSEAVADALRERYALTPAPYRLADTLNIALGVRAGPAAGEADAPEILLQMLDRHIAPRLLVNGRYEFAGTLHGPADLGFSPDLWLRCRSSSACIAAHDRLFASGMANVSLAADLGSRVDADMALRQLPELAQLTDGAAELQQRLLRSTRQPREAAAGAAAFYWQALGGELDPLLSAGGSSTDMARLNTLLTLGRSSAWLAGSETLATSYTVTASPLLEFARHARIIFEGGSFIGATAGVGLLFAGVQALALFDRNAADSAPPAALERMVSQLHQQNYRQFVGMREQSLLTSNTIDTRLVRLGIALDVVKEDVARIESAQRARVRSEYLVQDARRWSAFDEDNDRCFSLRSQDPRTGRLRPADFRRCEDSFLQGAVRRSQYGNRARDYVLDPRYLEPADLRFPFHNHYPLLLTLAGMDSNAALAMSDPYEWQQHATALLRLYQENPAPVADYNRRAETLRSLRAAGQRMHDALAGLVLSPNGRSAPVFREDVHAEALAAYFSALEALIDRVSILDDPAADPWGKRLTTGLNQPLAAGGKREVAEARLSGAVDPDHALRACEDAPAAAFLATEDGLLAEARRFFDSPVTTAEIARSWNQDAIAGFGLRHDDHVSLVPAPFLWTALEGLGELEFCLARFRPAVAEFTRDEGPLRNHLRANARIDASLEVRFRPGEWLATELDLDPARPPVVIARYETARSCSFAYRNDAEGCSRGQCLADLAPQMWQADSQTAVNGGRCAGDPLPQQLGQENLLADASELIDFAAALWQPWWERRAPERAALFSNAMRSTEYERAAAAWLQYFALATTTLGIWPDPAEPLAPLYAGDEGLSPRTVLAMILDEGRSSSSVLAELEQQHQDLRVRIARRGLEVADGESIYRLPHLAGLREALSRIDLLLAAYQQGT